MNGVLFTTIMCGSLFLILYDISTAIIATTLVFFGCFSLTNCKD